MTLEHAVLRKDSTPTPASVMRIECRNVGIDQYDIRTEELKQNYQALWLGLELLKEMK